MPDNHSFTNYIANRFYNRMRKNNDIDPTTDTFKVCPGDTYYFYRQFRWG